MYGLRRACFKWVGADVKLGDLSVPGVSVDAPLNNMVSGATNTREINETSTTTTIAKCSFIITFGGGMLT